MLQLRLRVASALLCASCGLDSFPVPEEGGLPETKLVAPDEVDGSALCVTLGGGEAVRAVSPEGHAWIVAPAPAEQESGQRLRVVDPYGLDPSRPVEVDLPPILQLRAWSGTEATALTEEAAYTLRERQEAPEGLGLTRLPVPAGVDPGVAFCGDLERQGFLATGAEWVELRGDQWWRWAQASQDRPRRFLARDGQCYGPDQVAWVQAEGGGFWRLGRQGALRLAGPADPARVVGAAASDFELAVLTDARLYLGVPGDWTAFALLDGVPRSVAGAADALWVLTTDELLRWSGGRFTAIRGVDPAVHLAREILPHAAGAWLVGDGQACNVAVEPAAIRIEGPRPHERRVDDAFQAFARLASARREPLEGWRLRATLDGVPLDLAPGPEDGWALSGSLSEPGSHLLAFFAEGAGQTAVRRLYLEREGPPGISWVEEVQPLYATTCTQAGCHGPGSRLGSFATYGDWIARAQILEDRLVVSRDMPPPGAAQGWGQDEVDIIAAWFEGGMQP